MDKKYILGIFIVFVVLAGIGIILLNPGISSAAKVPQNLYTSPSVDCCGGLENYFTNNSDNMNTSTYEVKIDEPIVPK